jgi:hypothetical protein
LTNKTKLKHIKTASLIFTNVKGSKSVLEITKVLGNKLSNKKQYLGRFIYKYQYLVLALNCILISCGKQIDYKVNGMKPVYISMSQLQNFQQISPQPIQNSGKSLLYNQYLFLSENNQGIHIVDISDTLHPAKISFLQIPGNKDMSAQNDRLYADNGPDLLVLDISQINQIKLVQRIKNSFLPSEYSPSDYSGYFECADYSNGKWLIGWQETQLLNPKCKK